MKKTFKDTQIALEHGPENMLHCRASKLDQVMSDHGFVGPLRRSSVSDGKVYVSPTELMAIGAEHLTGEGDPWDPPGRGTTLTTSNVNRR